MTNVAVRTFASRPEVKARNYSLKMDSDISYPRVFVFDTETTIDRYQNLKIGYFQVYQEDFYQQEGVFYDPSMLNEKESRCIVDYASKHNIELYTLKEFVEDVFYPEVYKLRSLCIGYNLAFDISRLAHACNPSRKWSKGGFTFTLSKKKANPQIIIRKMGDANTFKFTTTKENRKNDYFPGDFLDVQRLAEVLLESDHISLAKACERLGTRTRKIADIEYGDVTEDLIEYLITDVRATYEVYLKLMQELKLYSIPVPPTRIYSAASMGKYALASLGVVPFRVQNPEFPPEIVGNIMASYYGGRCECMVRKKTRKTTVLDFTSMYPTLVLEMDLWKYIIADSIETHDVTDEVKEMLPNINHSYLQDSNKWKDFVVLVKMVPCGDILPVRMDYKKEGMLNVAQNYLSIESEMWYTLPDVIASCLVTGKEPEIKEAVRFVPKGVQNDLVKSTIFGTEIDPAKDNLIKFLVEERQRVKEQIKKMEKANPQYKQLEDRSRAIKILVNAMCYGIFIELNPENEKSSFNVYGLAETIASNSYFERPGRYFNPLIATMITAGSRLFLTMAETHLKKSGRSHIYMDTDSIFVPPETADDLINHFQPLSPYDTKIPLLKKEWNNVLFYGISSKRYSLYTLNEDRIELAGMGEDRSYKLHGLGHLANPFPNENDDWHAEVWYDILRLHHEKTALEEIVEKYGMLYSLSKFTVSTPEILDYFKTVNKLRPWKKRIKPFNFAYTGFQTILEGNMPVKPLVPYTSDSQTVVYGKFIDLYTGKVKEGMKYFKPLSKTIIQYVDHREVKFNCVTGMLERKQILADGIMPIGKETNKIDEQILDGRQPQVFLSNDEREKILDKLLEFPQKTAEKLGVNRGTLAKIKRKIRKNRSKFRMDTKATKKLVQYLYWNNVNE
ncbi:DNA polymerase [Methanococcoides cohabitans]|uniref:DNA polymerase n=1 Tax=Methanococcoides cohabitans TaxID=3136559 RepID=A0ABU9KS98_9EURY